MDKVQIKFMSLLASMFLLGHLVFVAQAGTFDQRVAVEEVMRRANDYFLANFSIGPAVWDRSAYHTGNVRAWETLGIQAYYDRSVAWAEANSWLRGPEGVSHADAHCCGQAYIDLYNVDPQPVRTNDITSTFDIVLSGDYANDWWWIDAIYMAAPTLARLGVLNSDTNYFDAFYTMYLDTKNNRGLFDASRGLWWRDGGYYGTDTYWGRGNGWVIAACARVLEQLPADDTTYRPEFESMLQTMATALLPWQQSDGFWRSDIIAPSNYPTPETSCTAFFTYAIAYGINEGILVDTPGTNYSAAATNAWNGMVSIALHENGKLGYAQSIGAAPGPSSYDNDKDYAYGAFLLAGCEILRMMGGPVPVTPVAGADFDLIDDDANYTETVALSASNSVLRSGSIEGYSWWHGSTYLGAGAELDIDFPLGTNTVTLKIEHSDGNTYSSDITVKVFSPRLVVSASGYESGSTNFPLNTLDGNLDSRWSQDGNDGSQWIQYSLPGMHTLDHIDMAFFKGSERQARFAIWLSADGSVSNLVRVLPASGDSADYISSSGTTTNLETFGFPAQSVKSIRIKGWGNSASSWNSITETQIPISTPPVLNDQTDGDGNGFPDSWENHYLGSTGQVASAEIGETGITLDEAYVLGLDPVTPDTSPLIQINAVSNQLWLSLQTTGAFGVGYQGLTRKYSVLAKTELTNAVWTAVSGYEAYIGDNLPLEVGVTNTLPAQFFRIQSWLE